MKSKYHLNVDKNREKYFMLQGNMIFLNLLTLKDMQQDG